MKTIFFFFVFLPSILVAQSLMETVGGDEIFVNPNGLINNFLLGSINPTEQSLQIKTFYALPNPSGITPNKYFVIGAKGKPSDGIATLFSGGKFNPSNNFNISYIKIFLFADRDNEKSKIIDFVTLKFDQTVNKYTLFRPDSVFNNQINNFNFNGSALTVNYNLLIKGRHLASAIFGYSRQNNYSDLEQTEIRDFKTIMDLSGKIKEYGKTITGRLGEYKEYDRFPLRLSYTICPSEDEKDKDKLKSGFTLYYSANLGKTKPVTNLGFVLFLTKPSEKTGIRNSIINLGVQANDFFDVKNKETALKKRLVFTLATIFNLATF